MFYPLLAEAPRGLQSNIYVDISASQLLPEAPTHLSGQELGDNLKGLSRKTELGTMIVDDRPSNKLLRSSWSLRDAGRIFVPKVDTLACVLVSDFGRLPTGFNLRMPTYQNTCWTVPGQGLRGQRCQRHVFAESHDFPL